MRLFPSNVLISMIVLYNIVLYIQIMTSSVMSFVQYHTPPSHIPTSRRYVQNKFKTSYQNPYGTKRYVGHEDDKQQHHHDESIMQHNNNINSSQLLSLLRANPKCDATQISPTSLAYIGDVVYELFIRSRYIWPPRRTTDLQNLVVGNVRAESQSKLYRKVIESFPLSSNEQTILSRGRNAGSSSGGKRSKGPKRLYSTNNNTSSSTTVDGIGGPSAYQEATALEALIGYVYLTNENRCAELLDYLGQNLED